MHTAHQIHKFSKALRIEVREEPSTRLAQHGLATQIKEFQVSVALSNGVGIRPILAAEAKDVEAKAITAKVRSAWH